MREAEELFSRTLSPATRYSSPQWAPYTLSSSPNCVSISRLLRLGRKYAQTSKATKSGWSTAANLRSCASLRRKTLRRVSPYLTSTALLVTVGVAFSGTMAPTTTMYTPVSFSKRAVGTGASPRAPAAPAPSCAPAPCALSWPLGSFMGGSAAGDSGARPEAPSM